MFWPVAYMLMLAAIAVLIKYNTTKRAMVFLFVFLSIQVLDFFPSYQNINYAETPWVSPLQSHLWNRFMEKSEHIVFIPAKRQYDYYVPFALLAANHRKTINVGYTARKNYKDRKIYAENVLSKFMEGKVRNDTLYIIHNSAYLHSPESPAEFIWGNLDGYSIIAPKIETYGGEQVKLEPWPTSG